MKRNPNHTMAEHRKVREAETARILAGARRKAPQAEVRLHRAEPIVVEKTRVEKRQVIEYVDRPVEVVREVPEPVNEELRRTVETLKAQLDELRAANARLEQGITAASADLEAATERPVPEEIADLVDQHLPHGQAQAVLRSRYSDLINMMMLGVIGDTDRRTLERLQPHVHWLMGSGNIDVI